MPGYPAAARRTGNGGRPLRCMWLPRRSAVCAHGDLQAGLPLRDRDVDDHPLPAARAAGDLIGRAVRRQHPAAHHPPRPALRADHHGGPPDADKISRFGGRALARKGGRSLGLTWRTRYQRGPAHRSSPAVALNWKVVAGVIVGTPSVLKFKVLRSLPAASRDVPSPDRPGHSAGCDRRAAHALELRMMTSSLCLGDLVIVNPGLGKSPRHRYSGFKRPARPAVCGGARRDAVRMQYA